MIWRCLKHTLQLTHSWRVGIDGSEARASELEWTKMLFVVIVVPIRYLFVNCYYRVSVIQFLVYVAGPFNNL